MCCGVILWNDIQLHRLVFLCCIFVIHLYSLALVDDVVVSFCCQAVDGRREGTGGQKGERSREAKKQEEMGKAEEGRRHA